MDGAGGFDKSHSRAHKARIRGGGLEGWEDGGFLNLVWLRRLACFGVHCSVFVVFLLHHFLDEKTDGAFAFFGFADFGFWREHAESGVDSDLFDGFDRFWSGIAVGCWFGEVEAGDL
jgi:hypothetical protein